MWSFAGIGAGGFSQENVFEDVRGLFGGMFQGVVIFHGGIVRDSARPINHKYVVKFSR